MWFNIPGLAWSSNSENLGQFHHHMDLHAFTQHHRYQTKYHLFSHSHNPLSLQKEAITGIGVRDLCLFVVLCVPLLSHISLDPITWKRDQPMRVSSSYDATGMLVIVSTRLCTPLLLLSFLIYFISFSNYAVVLRLLRCLL